MGYCGFLARQIRHCRGGYPNLLSTDRVSEPTTRQSGLCLRLVQRNRKRTGARCRHYLFSNMDQQHEWHTSYSHEECAVFRRSGIGKLSIPLLDPNPASRLEGNKGGYLPLSADRVPGHCMHL